MNAKNLLLILSCSAALLACGEKPADTAAAPAAPTPVAAAPAPAPEPAPTPVAENAVGKKVYGSVCSMCHAAGVAGAPKPGDKADWGPRIAQGKDTLYKHALEGFTGAKGMMPARGGSSTLTDDELKAAVDHMVAQSL
ncbi:cytochrome c5 family protein [Hydrogenophaga taeniospiralis]|uniref:c-type cytochrome n=1 Tax=Hydrogenophaga taeniospiralis TaxID=65656 RepID=UPI001CF9A357|nr:c-type cytochrome [Hydrogenophaga taeniospiralis]MCB4366116.1 cytochrome c5 family protein [Hydrogenophaga taeniospiralis]